MSGVLLYTATVSLFVGIVLGPLLYGVMLKNGVTHGECLAVFSILALATALMPALASLQLRPGRAPR